MAVYDLPQGAALVVLFDGRCGFCTRWVFWLTGRDRDHRVVALPRQTPGVLERYGATVRDVERTLWAIDHRGRIFVGASAVNRALRELPEPWRWLAVPYAIGPVARAQDVVYGWIADHRSWLARWGVTPACAQPGAVCEAIDIA